MIEAGGDNCAAGTGDPDGLVERGVGPTEFDHPVDARPPAIADVQRQIARARIEGEGAPSLGERQPRWHGVDGEHLATPSR